jgi:hypothetical protein
LCAPKPLLERAIQEVLALKTLARKRLERAHLNTRKRLERAHLKTLLTALGATRRALWRDTCGDRAIKGKRGLIYADGSGLLIVVCTGGSIRRWANIKRKLGFCRVTQDGDQEGCLHLDHLPTPKEADLILRALGIKHKRRYTPDQLAALTARLKKKSTSDPSRPANIRQKKGERA